MDIKDHPCAQGLTLECFRAYPQWAKKMFAYRLLLTLCPHEITKRLPQLKGLFPLLVPPDWPASDPWVPGYSIDPAAVFPPGWTPGDPLPDGVTLDPGTVFPPGWTAGDPLPEGVSISAKFVFPPGWTVGDKLPEGVSVGVQQRPAILGSGATPPLYIRIWEPGPPHRPSPSPETKPVTVEITSSIKDGYVRNDDAVWSTARTAGTGDAVNDSAVNYAKAIAVAYWSGVYNVYRSFFYFDLSVIPAGKTISEVVLLLTELIYHDTGVAVFEGTQAATLTTADFDSFESIEFASQVFVDGENEIELNSDGIQFVQDNIGSEIKFCCRESDYDVGNVAPPASSNRRNGCYYANSSTAAYRPRLKVTYV